MAGDAGTVKEHVTPHADWCQGRESQVFWDQESNVSECRECGAVTEEVEGEVEVVDPPESEGDDGHPT
jgi:hypothetical protein